MTSNKVAGNPRLLLTAPALFSSNAGATSYLRATTFRPVVSHTVVRLKCVSQIYAADQASRLQHLAFLLLQFFEHLPRSFAVVGNALFAVIGK